MKLAIFDFDGTLLRGNSYHLFFRWVLRARPGRAPGLLFCLLLRRLRLAPARFLKNRTLAVLRGLTGAEVSALGLRLYDELLALRLRPAGLQEIAARRADGCEIVLVTGAFDFLVAPFTEAQAIATWRATGVAFRNGQCEGVIAGVELSGREKLKVVDDLFTGQTVDWAESWAYGDEEGDLFLLARVGHPVWVKSHRPVPRALPPACKRAEWGSG
ncbi:MAG TPA: HAD-IB family phosphatase [Opitutaceae bacterium]|jgi:HAD superfamily hydrolase (TIGR01490 family)|nr:HAD-IB family phosphatase [Opitutaceae bacterium]